MLCLRQASPSSLTCWQSRREPLVSYGGFEPWNLTDEAMLTSLVHCCLLQSAHKLLPLVSTSVPLSAAKLARLFPGFPQLEVSRRRTHRIAWEVTSL